MDIGKRPVGGRESKRPRGERVVTPFEVSHHQRAQRLAAFSASGYLSGVRSLEEARVALARHRPRLLTRGRRAAVAVMLHEAPAGPEMLFIERARRLGDPWSGHMAFPGGRVDPTDADERAAAERETREEIGVDLAPAELLGRLDDIAAGIALVAPIVLSAFVYRIGPRPPLQLNSEVAGALWVPIATLLDPACNTGYGWGPFRLPGVCVGDPSRNVVWGLTFRLVDSFLDVTGLRSRP